MYYSKTKTRIAPLVKMYLQINNNNNNSSEDVATVSGGSEVNPPPPTHSATTRRWRTPPRVTPGRRGPAASPGGGGWGRRYRSAAPCSPISWGPSCSIGSQWDNTGIIQRRTTVKRGGGLVWYYRDTPEEDNYNWKENPGERVSWIN